MNPEEKSSGSEEKGALSEMLDLMWRKFLPEIRGRARLLEDAARDASAGELGQDERLAAQAAAHKLAGTLGTFGLERGTSLARELESMYSGERVADADFARRASELAGEIFTIIASRK